MKNKMRKVFREVRMIFLRKKLGLKNVHKTFYLGGTSKISSDLKAGAYAYIDEDNTAPFIMNETTSTPAGVAQVSWTGGAITGATWRVRKYGFKPYKAISDIPASGTKDIPVTLIDDPQQI